MKKFILYYLAFVMLIVLGFLGYRKYLIVQSKSNIFTNDDQIQYTARIEDQNYQLFLNNKWKDITIKGVNLGVAEPGSFPGDMSIDKETYLRWFRYISDMNANTIRVYTLQNTAFYEALYEFNLNNSNPLYVIHGVWVNEEAIAEYYDAFEEELYDGFMEEAMNIINAIHGNAVVEAKSGHASGKYTKDISQYVIGWILGIEYEAELVNNTNSLHEDRTSYEGNYLYTENASPFEVFLAETGDKIITYEVEKYKMQRPTAFSNWVTTDPLSHPNEPNPEMEDSAVVDVEHIKWNQDFQPGMFASYHIYPYYPDFLNYDTKYTTDRENGIVNTYRAYLEELTKYHSLPVLVAEVGLPTSRGIAHRSIYSGYNQGFLTEREQGNYLCDMIDDIMETNCLGFLVFSWQDEWFKRSWNTMDLENPERRPFWLNVETGEKNFGLLSFDAGKKDTNLYVDGRFEDWSKEDVLLKTDKYSLSIQEDSAYLYLMIDAPNFDFDHDTLYIPIDTIKNQGISEYQGYSFDKASDFIIRINGKDHSEVLVDPFYDVFYFQYAIQNNLIEIKQNYNQENTRVFSPILLALNNKLSLPETNETIKFESVNTGKLRYGISNPREKEYDSLSDFYYSNSDGKIELRIPWALLSFSDPSTGEILDNYYDGDKKITFTNINQISFGIAQNTTEQIPFADYQLHGWNTLVYHERLKQSYYILQQKYGNIN